MRRGATTARRGTLDSRPRRPAVPNVRQSTTTVRQGHATGNVARPTFQKTQPMQRTKQVVSPVTGPTGARPPRRVSQDTTITDKRDPATIVEGEIRRIFEGGAAGKFVILVESCKKLNSMAKSKLIEATKAQFRTRVSSIDVSSMSSLVDAWNRILKDAKRIQAILKYLVDPIKEDTLPHWKALEEKKKRARIGYELVKEIWKDEVYPRAKDTLREEMDKMLAEIREGAGGGRVASVFSKMEDLGFNTFEPIVDVVNKKYEETQASLSESQRVIYLLDEINKLSNVYAKSLLQKAILVPKLNELVMPLITKRDAETLMKLKGELVSEFGSVYSDIVSASLRDVQLPVDFFSISALATFFSSVMYSDLPVRSLISSHIVKQEGQMIQEFVSVLFSHFDMPANVKQLQPMVRCFTKQEQLGNELVRGFLLRILQKRSSSKEKEVGFLKLLETILPEDVIKPAKAMLREITFVPNYIVTNISLSLPLFNNDSAVFPEDLIGAVEKGFEVHAKKFTNRKFKFAATFSLALVKGTWQGKEYLLTMSVLQYSLLQMILKGDMSFKKTHASLSSLNFALKLLTKGGLIKKVGPRFEFCENPPKEKKMNLYNGAINVRNVEHVQAVEEHDNTLAIQSTSARIMKAKRRMLRTELEKVVTTEVSEKFNVRDKQVETVIDGLIKTDYLEVDSNDTRFILYVP